MVGILIYEVSEIVRAQKMIAIIVFHLKYHLWKFLQICKCNLSLNLNQTETFSPVINRNDQVTDLELTAQMKLDN